MVLARREVGQKEFAMNDMRSLQIPSDQVPDAPEAMPNIKVIEKAAASNTLHYVSLTLSYSPQGRCTGGSFSGGGNGPPSKTNLRFQSRKSTARATRLGGSVSRGKV